MGAKPRILVSACLVGQRVRYDGNGIDSPAVRSLGKLVEWVPVCPEVEIGLGVPRPKIRLVPGDDGLRLLQPDGRRDLTQSMFEFGNSWCSQQTEIDGIILKSRSPSCGLGDAMVFADWDDPSPVSHGEGRFATVVRQVYPGVPCVSEVELEVSEVFARFVAGIGVGLD